MQIINFEYKNNKTYAVLISKKGTKFKVAFSMNNLEIELPGNNNCPESVKEFIKNFLISKEVLEFSYKWEKTLSDKQKWLGYKISKALYELEKGQRYFSPTNYRKKSATYKPLY